MRKLQTVRLNNGEKAVVNRDDITISYRGKTIDLERIVKMMDDVQKNGAVFKLHRDIEGKIIVTKL